MSIPSDKTPLYNIDKGIYSTIQQIQILFGYLKNVSVSE